jgi:hypothetical protein
VHNHRQATHWNDNRELPEDADRIVVSRHHNIATDKKSTMFPGITIEHHKWIRKQSLDSHPDGISFCPQINLVRKILSWSTDLGVWVAESVGMVSSLPGAIGCRVCDSRGNHQLHGPVRWKVACPSCRTKICNER